MKITINEQLTEIESASTLFALRDAVHPNADVIVVNGAPARDDQAIAEGDAVVFIRRGETPSREELEALMTARHTPGVHKKLKAAHVGIAGLGGLGSAIAIALARIGVGKLTLADYDVVEPSNLNRQQYFVDQLGMNKTNALAQNLDRVNPYVDVVTHTIHLNSENLCDVFGEVDVLVEAFDTADGKAMIAETYQRQRPGTPLVMATGLAGHAPSNTVRTQRLGKSLVVVGDLVTAAQPGTGLMAPRVGVAAHHQANAVLRILLGEDPEA